MNSVESTTNIPTVDMRKLAVGREESAASDSEWQRVGEELCQALSGVGFVYLRNHGVTEHQVNTIISASKDFFSLDEQIKLSYGIGDVMNENGYLAVTREKLDPESNQIDLRESYYMGDNNGVYPDAQVPQLRPVATAFVASCMTLTKRVLTALSLGLGQPRDFFLSKHRWMCAGLDKNTTVMRVNHYPPIPAVVPENAIRCGTHTDYGSITLLFQDSMGGLQVRGVDGQWVDAVPIPGTVLVNTGDLLQIWTAKRLLATPHRVVIPKDELRLRSSRYSVAFFAIPDCDELVEPMDGSSSPPPITARQHLKNMFAKTYRY